jgi:hypothetical protein
MEQEIVRRDFFMAELPDLSKAKAAPLELTGEYWTPEREGEVRRVFFKEIRTELTIDFASGADVDLSVAYFVEVQGGNKKVIRQASKRLTGALENLKIATGTPLEITYLGKKKNKTNSFMSDSWSIKPLYIEGGEVKYENAVHKAEQEKAENANRTEIGFDAGTPDGDKSVTPEVDIQPDDIKHFDRYAECCEIVDNPDDYTGRQVKEAAEFLKNSRNGKVPF